MNVVLATVLIAAIAVILGLGLRAVRSALQRRGVYRPGDERLIAGVCAGLAHQSKLSADQIRLTFVASFVLPGSQLLLYAALWALMPPEARVRAHTAGL